MDDWRIPSAKGRRRALYPAMALLAALAVTVNIAIHTNADAMDRLFGGGGRQIAAVSGGGRVSTPADGLREASLQVSADLEERYAHALGAGADLEKNSWIAAARPIGTEGQPLYEFSPALYQGLEGVCAGTVGLVFIGRQTGENQDAWTGAYDDGTPHMLTLTAAERGAVAWAKRACGAVVAVLASPSPMEVSVLEDDPGVSAILWLGGAGSTGYLSLGDVLAGRVNPSGRLPDT